MPMHGRSEHRPPSLIASVTVSAVSVLVGCWKAHDKGFAPCTQRLRRVVCRPRLFMDGGWGISGEDHILTPAGKYSYRRFLFRSGVGFTCRVNGEFLPILGWNWR